VGEFGVMVRPYQPGDEVGIAEAHRRSIHELCSKDYAPEQIADWGGARIKPERYVESITKNSEKFFVLDDSGTIGGFAGWFGEEIQGFYMHPEYVGKGWGRKLFQVAETDFWQATQHPICTIISTITAKLFYEKMGYKVVSPYVRTFRSGVSLDCWKMEKQRPA
jgi:GNAT superfamily N-acetyltransferase